MSHVRCVGTIIPHPSLQDNQGCLQVRATQAAQRPHTELRIYWSPINEQTTWAAVDTEADCTRIHANPPKHRGQWTAVDVYGDRTTQVKTGLILG